MLNQVVLVGRLVKDLELKDYEKGKYAQITLAVPRSYKNTDGEYETDFINCTLWQGVASNTSKYCKKGDIIGIKGRIQSSNYKVEDKTKYTMEVIAEKVTFLSSKQEEEK